MSEPNDVNARPARPKHRRRWRWLAGLVALGLVLYYVPFIPYSPSCGVFKSLEGKTSEDFRRAVIEQMTYFRRTFLVANDVILLRFPDWTGWPLFDKEMNGDIMINVNNKAIRSIVRDRHGVPLNSVTIDPQGPATDAEYDDLWSRADDCEIARQFVILPDDGE